MSVTVMAAVFAGSESRGATRLVALALADAAADTGEVTAYARSQSSLQAKAAVSRSGVARAIERLVELGEVEVLRAGDGRASSDYQINVDLLASNAAQIKAGKLARFEGVRGEPPQIEGVHHEPPGASPRTPRGVTMNPLGVHHEPPIIPSSPVVASSPPITSPNPVGDSLFPMPDPQPEAETGRTARDDFDEFWLVYPRKVSKGSAWSAWPKAVTAAGSAAAITVAARSYAEDPNRDPIYTRHPSTWLRGECWNDDPLPPRSSPAKFDPDAGIITSRTGSGRRLDLR